MTPSRAKKTRHLDVDLAHIDLIRGSRPVLRNLRWRIRPGQRWLLHGANGAGKTQLLKLIAGDVWPQPRADVRRHYRWRGEVSAEPYDVKEHIAYLGAERQDRYRHYDWDYPVSTIVGTGILRSDTPLRPLSTTEQLRVTSTLRRLGILSLARKSFLALSQGEQRLVLLARALIWRPALLLLDEPLNGLDEPNRQLVLKALDTLARSRMPWVYASHRLEEVPATVTHCARLAHGRVRTRAWAPAGAHRPRKLARARVDNRARRRPDRLLIELREASVWYAGRPVLRRLTLQIRRGECWVVQGPNGSGKSTFLATVRGEHAVASGGSIWRAFVAPGAPLSQFEQHVAEISPALQAALPRALSALESVVAGVRGTYHLEADPSASETRLALHSLAAVGARWLAGCPLGQLSYGQARRVLFARALARRPDIVLLDEPYTGLDSVTRAKLRSLVEDWARGGRTILIATHHRDDWPRSSTHELELVAGRSRYCGGARALSRARAGARS